ncbi:MAG TPA: DnaJ domain-containing protein [Thermomicrobiaceae bacterium]|nr:DnaJ domain-containing protein [Thermomicrobiaceae bacterium]
MPGTRTDFDPTIDYYQVLDVSYTATRAEITRAYRGLMRHAHPDRFSTEQERRKAEERAKLLNAAYAVLTRPESRQEYDRAIRQRAMADALMQRYSGNAPGRGSPFASERRPISPATQRARRRAGRSALLHLVVLTVIFVAALIAILLIVTLVPQFLHALLG